MGPELEPEGPTPEEELRELNGRAMGDLLATLGGMDGNRVAELRRSLPLVAGEVNVPRLRVAFEAVAVKGNGKAHTFALGHRDDMDALEFMNQRDAVLKFVDPGFKPPTAVAFGDKIMGGKAVVHSQRVRIRKGSSLTWQANNPGALGSEPSAGGFKLDAYGAYPGKTIGPASIGIFPDEGSGAMALYAWIGYKAGQGATFKGFFASHAPAPAKDASGKEIAGNKGNNPNLYFEEVAKRMGLAPEAVANQPLSSVDVAALAGAMQVQEGWRVEDEVPWDDEMIPEKDRFLLLYSLWLNPELGMPPG
jgi:hypothetical protein